MNNIDRITKVIDQISLWSGRAVSWLIIPMAAVLIWEVFIRYTFSPRSGRWTWPPCSTGPIFSSPGP